jgi:WD40-like Beta Propeller Repeat
VSTVPRGGSLYHVSYAPDGRSLVISGYDFESAECGILRVGLDGRGTMLVSSSADFSSSAEMGTISVSPDGAKLAWALFSNSYSVRLLEPK